MEIRIIDAIHGNDINLPNQPFPLRGRMVVSYTGTQWRHREELLPEDQITEMVFPDENYVYSEKKDSLFLGAYDGEACIGLAILNPAFGNRLYISDLKVDRLWRRKGVGRQLICKAQELAKERNYAGMYVVAQDNNLDACLFYLSCGFEIGGLDTMVYQGTNQEGKSDIYFYK